MPPTSLWDSVAHPVAVAATVKSSSSCQNKHASKASHSVSQPVVTRAKRPQKPSGRPLTKCSEYQMLEHQL